MTDSEDERRLLHHVSPMPTTSKTQFLSGALRHDRLIKEDHDHDLPRCTGRCCRHHHRWILRTVNAKAREIHRHQQHRVPNSEPATSAFAYIAPIHEAGCRTDERGSSLSKVPPSARFCRNTHHR
ncbi:hypothetical protein HN011_001665 [Eciton burchellii]|nr:hypothetical protein HN011_001665 [Eciton burchellii]